MSPNQTPTLLQTRAAEAFGKAIDVLKWLTQLEYWANNRHDAKRARPWQDLGIEFTNSFLAIYDLRKLLTPDIRDLVRRAYPAGSPPIALPGTSPSHTVIEVLADHAEQLIMPYASGVPERLRASSAISDLKQRWDEIHRIWLEQQEGTLLRRLIDTKFKGLKSIPLEQLRFQINREAMASLPSSLTLDGPANSGEEQQGLHPVSESEAAVSSDAVGVAIVRYAELATRSSRLLESWRKLRSTYRPASLDSEEVGYEELPEDITDFAALARHIKSRRNNGKITAGKAYLDRLDELVFAVRRWRNAIQEVRIILGSVSLWMDDVREPPVKRWTAAANGTLNSLAGLIPELTVGDIPQNLDEKEFRAAANASRCQLSELKRVLDMPPVKQQPSPLNNGIVNETDNDKFLPAGAFPHSIRERLRHAAAKKRKSMRVRTRKVGGAVLYSLEDVQRWWPHDLPKDLRPGSA